ncbi:MAG: hypothetical protein JSU69_03570 [Candidatus Zixiibacteriota bacterium]|nr:MAG: hypothetical protein JSU69_03570 [candidate division Zixibacteria bacterium]
MRRKIRNAVATVIVGGLATAQPAFASFEAGNMFSTSAIFNTVLLICAVICLIWSLKILSLVRGGLISRSWQMFALGFSFLTLAQMMVVAESAGVFAVPTYVTTVLYLMMTFTWLVGLYQTRKVLG